MELLVGLLGAQVSHLSRRRVKSENAPAEEVDAPASELERIASAVLSLWD